MALTGATCTGNDFTSHWVLPISFPPASSSQRRTRGQFTQPRAGQLQRDPAACLVHASHLPSMTSITTMSSRRLIGQLSELPAGHEIPRIGGRHMGTAANRLERDIARQQQAHRRIDRQGAIGEPRVACPGTLNGARSMPSLSLRVAVTSISVSTPKP